MKKIFELKEVETFVPTNIKSAIDNYVWYGCPPGSFVTAVLSNNLMNAIGQADEFSLENIKNICMYVYGAVPNVCYGSYEAVQAHIKKGQELNDIN